MSSIARKISVDFNLRLLYVFIWLDFIFVIFRIELWRFMTEAAAKGVTSFEELHYISLKGRFVCDSAKDAVDFMKNLCYEIPGVTEVVPAQGMILETGIILVVMLSAELYFVLSGFLKGGRRVRGKLAPLNKLAAKTQIISSAGFDGDSFHALEDALSKLDANDTECRVSTGNTELQGIEAAINNLIERMRKSYEQQTRFVSDASHELRTPISVIQGYANMLSRWGKEDEKILDESITAIKTESENMNRLVEQLLFLARGDNGKNSLTVERTDLAEMMREIYDEYRMVDKTHVFELKKSETEVITYGDHSLLKQAARILTDNAAKYTPEGKSITLSAYITEDGIPAFEVQDTGIGIPSEDIPKVFERFYRADDARNRKTGGTGLGLSIAGWIVDRHKGYFRVSSYVGVGTRFTVLLPENINDKK